MKFLLILILVFTSSLADAQSRTLEEKKVIVRNYFSRMGYIEYEKSKMTYVDIALLSYEMIYKEKVTNMDIDLNVMPQQMSDEMTYMLLYTQDFKIYPNIAVAVEAMISEDVHLYFYKVNLNNDFELVDIILDGTKIKIPEFF